MKKRQTKDEIEAVLSWAEDTEQDIQIVSGEGTVGTVETYDGRRTVSAIMNHLRSERADGDRWALVQAEDGYQG